MATRQRATDRGAELARRLVQDFGRDARDARRRASLSLQAVSRAVGISHGHLSRIERGLVPGLSIHLASRLAAVVGLDLSLRTYPGGTRIRDIGQVRLLQRFRVTIAEAIPWRTEVAVGSAGDLRAWDAILSVGGVRIGVEAEVHVHDWQALDRRIALRRRDTGIERVVLVLADTRHNRAVLRSVGPEILANFPVSARQALLALRAGEPPGGCTVVLV
jgi:transcriptional regulator with XRE-family HTH domain